MRRDILLLSIHPRYARWIFNGMKTIELRRVRPRVTKGDWVLVYVTSPLKILIGGCRVERLIEAPLPSLWSEVRHGACVSRAVFDEYYAGTQTGFAIVFGEVRRLDHPIGLRRLRELLPDFRPPQCYRYLSLQDVESLGIAGHWLGESSPEPGNRAIIVGR